MVPRNTIDPKYSVASKPNPDFFIFALRLYDLKFSRVNRTCSSCSSLFLEKIKYHQGKWWGKHAMHLQRHYACVFRMFQAYYINLIEVQTIHTAQMRFGMLLYTNESPQKGLGDMHLSN